MADVAGLVLAAGAGRRYGMPKALVRFEGRLFVERAVQILQQGGCAPVLAVLGAQSEQVRAELPDLNAVDNPDWPQGMGSSLRTGLDAITGDAVVVLPVDTPGIRPEAVRRLVALAGRGALLRASYHGEAGHPVLIGRDHWEGVYELATGDAGAREYLRRNRPGLVACEDISDGADVDRPGDLPA
ncbi:nicotine blue oxidoreductase [Kibdelosporangium banguiense]|uniref:Nicotine blue oxidoreductase n=1 Tax=Kibdelosporangium banguiense TaxID=1365924 RepID=A0ABS4TMX5_9PSEU|nr:nucleotidyltransferase family protein [Kibdelosporangium banguiense]MBP2325755.1 nicotine blue oxidoreductase [Kibdelosporangium banguiense]